MLDVAYAHQMRLASSPGMANPFEVRQAMRSAIWDGVGPESDDVASSDETRPSPGGPPPPPMMRRRRRADPHAYTAAQVLDFVESGAADDKLAEMHAMRERALAAREASLPPQ